MRARRALVVAGLVAGLVGAGLPARALNDPGFDRQWGMRLVRAPEAWATGTGTGITIAIVDTGIHERHEDLVGKVTLGANFVDEAVPSRDDNGHGTHLAGIAAANADNGRGVVGVAPGARLLSVKVLGSNGLGSRVDDGIRWAVDHGARVINLSLGSAVEPVLGPSFSEAIHYAWSKGVICVVSAGNEYVTSSGFSDEPALVVSAVRRDDTKPSYSSGVGAAQWGIAAPGGAGSSTDADDVFSTYWDGERPGATNLYAYEAGTSMAAPHVAGAAAILLALGLSAPQAVQRLLTTARDVGPRGRDSTFGHGRLDVAAAVHGLGGQPPGGGGGGTGTTAGPGGRPGRPPGPGGGGNTAGPGAPTPASPPAGAEAVDGAPAVPGGAEPLVGGDGGTFTGPSGGERTGGGGARDGPPGGRPWALAGLALALTAGVAAAARRATVVARAAAGT